MSKYILDEHGTPVLEPDVLKWAAWFEDRRNAVVAVTFLGGEVRISTVFLGIDDDRRRPNPRLWETRIFGGPHDGYLERYASVHEARAGHLIAEAIARGEMGRAGVDS